MKTSTKTIFLCIGIAIAIVVIAFAVYGYIRVLITPKASNPIATITIKDMGTITVELYPDMAPNTVKNFIALANNKFYDGLTFHRTIPSFMIQGGDSDGTGSGSPTLSSIRNDIEKGSKEDKKYSINGEFIANGFKQNTLAHERGIISMARADYSSLGSTFVKEGYNSEGSQFFITTKTSPSLDGLYTGFGRVKEGMGIVDEIAKTQVVYRTEELEEGAETPKDEQGNAIASDRPVNPPVIESIRVDTFGVDYGLPETHDVFDLSSLFAQ